MASRKGEHSGIPGLRQAGRGREKQFMNSGGQAAEGAAGHGLRTNEKSMNKVGQKPSP